MKPSEDSLKLMGIIGTVAVTCVGATWLVAQKLQADELQGYKTAQELRLKPAIDSLKEYAESAKLTTAERKKLIALETQVPALVKANADLTAKLGAVAHDRDALQSAVRSILQKTTEVEIPFGQAKVIIPNLVTLGVVTNWISSVGVTINGKEADMKPGSAQTVFIAGKPCTITLTKILPTAATFVVSEPE